jgi:MFS family permease
VRRSLAGLLVANAVSLIGSRMSLLAIPWFVLVTTGSATKTGIVAAAETIPYVLACAMGGPLFDRLGVRRTSIIADLASSVVVLAIPLLHSTVGLGFPALVALVALAGLLRGSGDTGKRVLFRSVVMTSGVDVTRATSLNDGINRLASLVGAPAAGLLLAVMDATSVLAIDAATFAFGAIAVALFVTSPATAVETVREPYFRSLRSGAAFLKRDRLILFMLIMFFCTNLFDAAYSSVLLPLWAAEIIKSPVVLGIAMACLSGGAVLGNIVFTAVAPRVPRFATFTIGFAIGGAPRFFVPIVTDDLWPVYVVSFAAGLGLAAVNPIVGAVSFERIPEEMQSRVQGLITAVAWAGIPVGALIGGWLGEHNIMLGLGALGVCYLAITFWPFLSPIWRQMEKPRQAVAQRLTQPSNA